MFHTNLKACWHYVDRAWAEHKDEIEALHKRECLDCPWDGHTIFPEKDVVAKDQATK